MIDSHLADLRLPEVIKKTVNVKISFEFVVKLNSAQSRMECLHEVNCLLRHVSSASASVPQMGDTAVRVCQCACPGESDGKKLPDYMLRMISDYEDILEMESDPVPAEKLEHIALTARVWGSTITILTITTVSNDESISNVPTK